MTLRELVLSACIHKDSKTSEFSFDSKVVKSTKVGRLKERVNRTRGFGLATDITTTTTTTTVHAKDDWSAAPRTC